MPPPNLFCHPRPIVDVSTPQTTEFVEQVERRLGELVDRERAYGEEVMGAAQRHLVGASLAKRARPRLVYHFGRLVDADASDLLDIAVSAELVHNASLLHDDVVDEGEERRGQPTVNVRWSNATSVLAGDALLCRALGLLRGRVAELTTTALEVVTEMTRGMMREVAARGRLELSREDWRHIAVGKTGALFGWCGRAPGLLVDRSADGERFETCGRRLGVAFQLADDLKDFAPGAFGKDELADLRNGYLSYPLICAVEASSDVREMIDAFWSEEADGPDPSDVRESVLATSAIDETRGTIRRTVDEAVDALGDDRDKSGGREVAFWARQLLESVEATGDASSI